MESTVEKLTNQIKNLKGFEITNPFSSLTYENMGATIIDAVLQAGINYDKAVKPRVQSFRSLYPSCVTTSDFLIIIKQTPISEIINWNGAKAERIVKLTEFLQDNNIQTEREMLEWLKSPANCALIQRVKGIKEKTTDYLKILSGERETVAIDIHLRNFIFIYGEYKGALDYDKAKTILLETAKKLNIPASKLDHSIWNFMSKRIN